MLAKDGVLQLLGKLLTGAIAGVVLCVSGCASGPAPADHFYRLDVASDKASPGACRLPGTLQVDRFQSDALTDGRQLVYQKDPSSPELGRYAFHLWVSPVSELLSQDLASYLGERGVATRVMTSGTSIAPDYTIRGRVVKVQHTLGPKAAAVLELQLTLTDDRQRKVLLHKAYSASQPAKSVADAAKAFGEEAQGIFGEFVADCASRMGGGGSSAE